MIAITWKWFSLNIYRCRFELHFRWKSFRVKALKWIYYYGSFVSYCNAKTINSIKIIERLIQFLSTFLQIVSFQFVRSSIETYMGRGPGGGWGTRLWHSNFHKNITVKIQYNPNMGPPGNFVHKEFTPRPPPK